jgi:hypothetical protein
MNIPSTLNPQTKEVDLAEGGVIAWHDRCECEAQGAALTACAAITGSPPRLGSSWAASVSLGRAQDSTIGGGFLALVGGI